MRTTFIRAALNSRDPTGDRRANGGSANETTASRSPDKWDTNLANIFEGTGKTDISSSQFAIVVSRYNESITSKLLQGALETLSAAGVSEDAVDVAWVPGAWEIPLLAQHFASSGYAAVLCLGAVIRGETTHDQLINQQVSGSLGRLALEHQIPILLGVLTCNTLEQAIHRSGGNQGNKGIECAEAALEMVRLLNRLRQQD